MSSKHMAAQRQKDAVMQLERLQLGQSHKPGRPASMLSALAADATVMCQVLLCLLKPVLAAGSDPNPVAKFPLSTSCSCLLPVSGTCRWSC